MRESIRGYADAIVEASADLESLAGEVGAVRDVLDGSAELLSVLTDPGVPSPARRAVFSDLFGARIGAGALRLVLMTVEAGRASELAEDVSWLATRTAAARDGLHVSGPAILGHHAATERVDGYAGAVLETVPDERALSEIEDELFRFERIVAGSTELTEALTGRDLSTEVRAGIVADLLRGKASPATALLAAYAATIGRPRDYRALLGALVARVAAETNRRIADVRAMVELTEAQQQRLADALSRLVGQRVEVRVVVDPSILGGFVATIGDTVVDGSLRHRLDLLKERLVLSEPASTQSRAQTDQGAQSSGGTQSSQGAEH